MIIEYQLNQKLDEQGRPEEFTSDTWLMLPRGTTDHLANNGLPKVGSQVYPGMLLIAKTGATASYRREAVPQDFEWWGEPDDVLIRKHVHMFYNGSFYVPDGIYGKVIEAFFDTDGEFQKAIVRIETTTQPLEKE